ncbi:MAG: type VI-A CRISPR-associated RNA-guided ribonuclease Cas13a [Lachnospiraceae bacterium]|nr:type VI-A CRISPR-associated RNA-guided ribonuclease Cas13a [Lachnospiraceae bacterium]
MKISKVKNTRSAIAKKKEKASVGGVLYTHPNGEVSELKKRFDLLDSKAKNLYNVFMPIEAGKAPKEIKEERFGEDKEAFKHAKAKYDVKKKNYDRRKSCERILKNGKDKKKKNITGLKAQVRKLLFYKADNSSTLCMREHEKILADIKKKLPLEELEEKLFEKSAERISAEEIVALSLRKSLRSQEKGAATLLKCFGRKPSSEEREEIIKFLKLVEKDFNKLDLATKDSSGSRLIRSFDNQNMLYQPSESKFILPVPSQKDKNKSYKKEEKEGLEEFLSQFADLDEENRLILLGKLRNIIDVYFSAPLEYEKNKNEPLPEKLKQNENVWKRHEDAKAIEERFVELPENFETAIKKHLKMDKVEELTALNKIKEDIRKKNMNGYRYSLCVISHAPAGVFFENEKINQFWVHHIEYAVERILNNFKAKDVFRLRLGYLTEKIWKDALNFISIKYIALGKAVYHFGMDDLNNKMKKQITLGKINDEIIKDGINSFDYEMIKAYETLQREVAVNVAFATNNLTNVVADFEKAEKGELKKDSPTETSDFLIWKADMIDSYRKDGNVFNDLLSFFGGKSKWTEFEKKLENVYNPSGTNDKCNFEVSFIDDLKKAIYALRNESYHFHTEKKDQNWNDEIFGMMFEQEARRVISMEKEAFYSNNLPMFYNQDDLKRILDRLYGECTSRASQVPAFNQVVKRIRYRDFLEKNGFREVINEFKKDTTDKETLETWENACYYLMKEIYYNIFLADDSAVKYFRKAVKKNYDEAKKDYDSSKKEFASNKNNKKIKAKFKERQDKYNANNDFQSYIKQSQGSISEICQYVMMEYNSQNNNQRKVRVAKKEEFADKTIFKHYKLLLLQNMSDAFGLYLSDRNNALLFIKKPNKGNAVKQNDVATFLPNWGSEKYNNLIKIVKKNKELQEWYVVGRFLNSRMLNHMVGSMRSFLQFTNDIRKRAKVVGNKVHKTDLKVEQLISEAIQVIEVCIRLSANVSSKFTDYFADEDAYAKFMNQYIAIGKENADVTFKKDMLDFCNHWKAEQLGIYADEKNPKLNRNIVFAKQYAPHHILNEILERVKKEDIDQLVKLKKDTIGYRMKGNCETKEEQENLVKYQRSKNLVELRDLVEYAELLNELQGQLVNWAYLRERDLLYFQLGFHYKCLHNKANKSKIYQGISPKGNEIKGVILHQITGMYVGGIGVWYQSEEETKKWIKQTGSTSLKLIKFLKYGKEVMREMGLKDENGEKFYLAGMEVFENTKEHDDIINLRNEIEHFRYFSNGTSKSMLDYYSEIFDRYFTYDMKYQKNVINLLENILLRHMVMIEPMLETGEKIVEKAKKVRAQISVKAFGADNFTYKYGSKKMTIGAKSVEMLKVFSKILYYPNLVPESICYQSENAKESGNSGGNK